MARQTEIPSSYLVMQSLFVLTCVCACVCSGNIHSSSGEGNESSIQEIKWVTQLGWEIINNHHRMFVLGGGSL